MKPKIGVQGHVAWGEPGQRRTLSGGVTNSSWMLTPRGLRARGFVAWSTNSGTTVVRAQ